ncbi:MAG TPA: hypothetical protein VH024_00935 [Candidatus Angelobacter sp.]|nr:hypothetical protein [Candidatus Angelobacter sp.]
MKPAIPIHENYGAYKPSLNARKTVESLIASIEPECLQGLGSIVLSTQFHLPRTTRRKKFLSRGSKYPTTAIQAYYQAQWKGQPAFIELYVDKILAPIPSWSARFPMVGFLTIGKVFFHELGHHIHLTRRPEFKEKEDVADQWSRKLMKSAFRKRYKYAVPMLRPWLPILNVITRLMDRMNRRYKQKQLEKTGSSHLSG